MTCSVVSLPLSAFRSGLMDEAIYIVLGYSEFQCMALSEGHQGFQTPLAQQHGDGLIGQLVWRLTLLQRSPRQFGEPGLRQMDVLDFRSSRLPL